jgi:hypothetical protein
MDEARGGFSEAAPAFKQVLCELAALEWEDVDLPRGTIHIHRSVDRLRGGTKSTKTGDARRFPIEDAILPLLATMRTESGGKGPVLPFMANKSESSKNLRQYLTWAGVTRAELYADDATRKRVTFHDVVLHVGCVSRRQPVDHSSARRASLLRYDGDLYPSRRGAQRLVRQTVPHATE